MEDAKSWLYNCKEFSVYELEEYDEGGYIGIDENYLYRMLYAYRKHCEKQK